MKIVNVLRCLLDRSHSRGTIDFAKSHLEKLPTEVLLNIVKFLPLHCAALLTLSSKSLQYKVGNEYLRNFSTMEKFKFKNGHDRYLRANSAMTHNQVEYCKFLNLLSEDLPDEVFCHFCQKIHTPKKTNVGWVERHAGLERRECYFLQADIQYGRSFNFPTINLALKRARQGLDPSKQLLSLSETFVVRQRHRLYRSSLQARIVEQRLYVRAIHRLFVPRKIIPSLPTSDWTLRICGHLESRGGFPEQPLSGHLLRTLAKYHGNGCITEKAGVLIQCRDCKTELCIEAEEKGKVGVQLVVTVWQDFGSGVQPFDFDFYSHFIDRAYRQKPVKFTASSIRDTFENPSPSHGQGVWSK
jgi:hypothetical protein